MFAGAAIASCQAPREVVRTEVVKVEVEKQVTHRCPDVRPARDYKDFPDDAEDLEKVPNGDYEALFRIAKEALRMARAWLALDEVQIKGCSAPGADQ